MTVWLTDIMMLLFAGAMIAVVVDMGRKYFGGYRQLMVGSVAMLAIALSLIRALIEWFSETPGTSVITPASSPFATVFVVDSFSLFIIITEFVVGLVIAYYATVYLSPKDNVGPFFALLLIMMVSILGISSAGDLLSLFLFWEGMSITAYGLVSFRRGSRIGLEATIKYFFLAGVGSLLSVYGISVIYSITGSLHLSAIAQAVYTTNQLGLFGLLMLVVGFGVEAAIVPLHTWLPDVYSAASAPVAALIAGDVTGIAVFVLVKIVQPMARFGGQPGNVLLAGQWPLILLSVVTMLLGNLSALHQTNLRRMLGFSSIAQTGYMLAAISTLSVPGLIAVVFNIWNHGLLKSSFFLTIGRRDEDLSLTELGSLGGLAGRSRLQSFMYASSSLALVGSPPFGLFWSELLIVQSLLLLSSTPFTVLALIVLANIVLSIGYYFRVINTVVSGSASGEALKAVRRREVVAPVALLLLSLLTGVIPGMFVSHIAMLGGLVP